jgi:hypothetical protein
MATPPEFLNSKWLDRRDVPAKSKFGKFAKPADCECTYNFSCKACCVAAVERNKP